MRIYVVNNATNFFYAGDGHWVAEERCALSFGSCIEALRMAIQLNLENVSILLAFDDRRYDIIFPVQETRARSEAFP